MPRPATLSEAYTIPDLLSNHRAELWFAPIPGVDQDNSSVGPRALRLKNVTITPPTVTIGQVRVPFANFPRAFRGHRDIGNQFTADFYEDVEGGTMRTLYEWVNQCCDPESDDSADQRDYSVQVELYVFDNMGALAHQSILTNVWPFSVTAPPTDRASSGPALVSVQFSVDFFDPEGILAINGD